MKDDNAKDILIFAKSNIDTFEKGGVSSNEIYIFDYDEKCIWIYI